jgi:hypothetical protein
MHEEFWAKFPPIPGFDCVKMKHEIQERLYEETRGMTPKEVLAYFERRSLEHRSSSPESGVMVVKEEATPYGEQ